MNSAVIAVTHAIGMVCYLVLFVGTFYLVLHNRHLPKWHLAPIWWAGLFSLITVVTYLLGFVFGNEFPLSYARVGMFAQTAVSVCLAILTAYFLANTYREDLRQSKNRRAAAETPKAAPAAKRARKKVRELGAEPIKSNGSSVKVSKP